MNSVDAFFSYCESFLNIERIPTRQKEYKLDRMQRMLHAANNPHKGLNVVHVAGSKGKGSTVTSIAHILGCHYRVGLFLSPHIVHYRERIQILPASSSDPYVLQVAQTVREIAEWIGDPTTFELLTLTAFLVFRQANCQWVVLETGLGGRLDCTNLAEPQLSIITSIEKEHCNYLGNTIEEIAFEKGGIIKRGIPLILGDIQGTARQVLQNIAQERQAPVFAIDEWVQSEHHKTTVHYTEISLRLLRPFARTEALHQKIVHLRSRLIGRVHVHTAAMALLATLLIEEDFSLSRFKEGIAQARLPGRMDQICAKPPLFFDGAHTPDSLSYSIETFFHLFPQGGRIIFGCIVGKDVPAMAQSILPYVREVVVTSAGDIRPSDPLQVNKLMQKAGIITNYIPDPVEAIRITRQQHPALPILVTGSFYLIATLWKSSSFPVSSPIDQR